MARTELFDPYETFVGYSDGTPRFPDDYPKNQFQPLHPLFAKQAEVLTGGRRPRRTYVDLGIGECQCEKGFAFMPDTLGNKGWYRNKYCTHKLRLMCSIIDNVSNDAQRAELRRAYLKALSTRYNKFEVVSAFHKELRRGDFEQAWYWGLMLANYRGMRGVFQYLLNILYEECRDHELFAFLLKVRPDMRQHTLPKLSQAISWFCLTKKKWELPHRWEIFRSEMLAYEKLATDYGTEPKGGVAGHGNFIPSKEKDRLSLYMRQGVIRHDPVQFQRGLKGLQKLRHSERDRPTDDEQNDHRYWLYERLYDLADELLPPTHDVWVVIANVNKRIEANYGIGYHELNAIGDAIMGEPADAGLLSAAQRKLALARPTGAIPLGKWPKIPLYAHDNHTYGGKALMRRYSDQLKPGAVQTDLDFRWCGAYFGVAFRMLSQRQLGKIGDWHEVKWDRDLYRITQILWY